MKTTKTYIRPATNVFMLSTMDRMMQNIAGSPEHPNVGAAPVRFPEDN